MREVTGFQQCPPTARGPITRGDRRDLSGPGQGEVGVVVGDGEVLGRVVRAVDAVADIGRLGEGLEAVQETGRDVQVAELGVVQQECLTTAESRRIGTDVDHDVVDRAMGATHQFGFPMTATTVQTADHATRRPRLRILHERGRCAGTEVSVEDFGVEGAGEQAASVTEGFGHQKQHVGEFGLFDSHRVIMP